METRAHKRWMHCAGSYAFLLALVAGSLSCVYFPDQEEALNPRARLLKQDELSVTMSRVGSSSRRVVTSAESLPVHVYFDPELVDLSRVAEYSLWTRNGDQLEWQRAATGALDSPPVRIRLAEGLLGLRGSVKYTDGTEDLVPLLGDEPALWVIVDRSPPDLGWIEPREDDSVAEVSSLELVWSSSDARFGKEPQRLEWSADRGQTWKPIDTVPAADGVQRYRWNVPEEVCSNILVRVASRDLAGHESSSVVALSYPGSVVSEVAPVVAVPEIDAGSREEPEVVEPPRARSTDETVETASAEAQTPVPPADPAGDSGDTVADADRVRSGATQTPPEAPGSDEPLRLFPFSSAFVGGGRVVPITWEYTGEAAETEAHVEWSLDGGDHWCAIATTSLSAGEVEWTPPAESGVGYLMRVRAELPDGKPLMSVTPEPFSIDADPPQIALGAVPEKVGQRFTVPVAISDPGGSGVVAAEVYLKAEGTDSWDLLDPSAARLEGNSLDLDLGDEVPEGTHQLFLRVFDRAGNASVSLEEAAVASGTAPVPREEFFLDRTAPEIRVTRGAEPWVGGLRGEAVVDVDWTEAVPPLVVEGRSTGDTDWVEISRWTAPTPNQNRFDFEIPWDAVAYSVRFFVEDSAGNRAIAELGPEPVRSPIRLLSFQSGRPQPAGSMVRVEWELDPAVVGLDDGSEDALKISVAHLPRRDGGWERIYELGVGEQCFWDLPMADREEHRLRVRLLRGDQPMGEDTSEPFSIVSDGAPPPVVIRISQDSLAYSDRARSLMDRYFAARASEGSGGPVTDFDRLRKEILDTLDKALAADARNYHATYQRAQFLNRLDSEANAEEVRKSLLLTIEIKPDHTWALNDLGAVYIRDGEFEKAEDVLRRSSEVEPSPVILYNLGLALFYGNKMNEARKALEAALKEGGPDGIVEGEVYYYVIQSYAIEGDLATARSLFSEKEASIPPELQEDLVKLVRG